MITVDPNGGTDKPTAGQAASGVVGSTGLEELIPIVSPASLELVDSLRESSARRQDTPIRKRFVRSSSEETPPLAQLVSTGGRGGGVAVKLYAALIWRCSAPPFDTDISARKWAALLALQDPNHLGARRVTAALRRLADLNLIDLTERRGESSVVTLRDESGDDRPYALPSSAYRLSKGARRDANIYFKVPVTLWESGHLQDMSAAAAAMLLILLSESTSPGRQVWWATDTFPSHYGISPAMRARGTRELVRRRLLFVQKQLVQNNPERAFGRERVRNLYQLINEAEPRPVSDEVVTKPDPKLKRRRGAGPRRTSA